MCRWLTLTPVLNKESLSDPALITESALATDPPLSCAFPSLPELICSSPDATHCCTHGLLGSDC